MLRGWYLLPWQGLILLLILIIKFKVHAMISILIGAVGIGLMAGMPLADIIGSV